MNRWLAWKLSKCIEVASLAINMADLLLTGQAHDALTCADEVVGGLATARQ
jgi:hypothetical protein